MSRKAGSAYGGKKFLFAVFILSVFILVGCVNAPLPQATNLSQILQQQTPDQSCFVDEDCKIAPTSCGPCDCGQAVNKNWQPNCQKKSYDPNKIYECTPCPPYTAKCFKYKCRVEIPPALNQPTTNNEQLPIAPKELFDLVSDKRPFTGQKFRFQGCLEPHTCSGPISNNQKCDINHLGVCCDCIKMGNYCPIVALENVAKEKLTGIRSTEETKYNVEVVGTYVGPAASRMRPVLIEASDLKILGECLL